MGRPEGSREASLKRTTRRWRPDFHQEHDSADRNRSRALISTCGIDAETAENALAKLWIHEGITVDENDRVFQAAGAFKTTYDTIRAHREAD